ncbi:MAG: tRNA pseudouridine(38-40) synthase TruA [Bacilli bacterium]|nr:tRNA pseudouridine(38-40) synthase TruA [Bacilli bacterium]
MKYKAIISYNGAAFKGFSRQTNEISVQEEVERVLSDCFGEKIFVHGSGRTDAGVHARGQVITFPVPSYFQKEEQFVEILNRLVNPNIAFLSIERCSDEFDARHSCVGKVYEYKINFGLRDPLAIDECQFHYDPFDYEKFKKCFSLYLGKHDFRNFTTKPFDPNDYVRNVRSIEIHEDKDHYRIIFTGDGFMTYMIRIMVGVALKVGKGKISLEEVASRLDPKDRKIYSFKAPAEGLTLMEVLYE